MTSWHMRLLDCHPSLALPRIDLDPRLGPKSLSGQVQCALNELLNGFLVSSRIRPGFRFRWDIMALTWVRFKKRDPIKWIWPMSWPIPWAFFFEALQPPWWDSLSRNKPLSQLAIWQRFFVDLGEILLVEILFHAFHSLNRCYGSRDETPNRGCASLQDTIPMKDSLSQEPLNIPQCAQLCFPFFG